MKYTLENKEVLYLKETISPISIEDICFLKKKAAFNSRKRIRACFHENHADLLHEMFIVHDKNTYVRPHKHPGKSESTHIIEGLVDIVLFDDNGKVERVINMGDYTSGKIFYYRMTIPIFHTLIIRSEILVFHETTNGPFHKEATIFAPWAPEDADIDSVVTFMSDLNKKIKLI